MSTNIFPVIPAQAGICLIGDFLDFVGDFALGGLDFDLVALLFAHESHADGGLHADAALERIDCLEGHLI